MAKFHSSLYAKAPNGQAESAPIYKGPNGHRTKGTTHVVRGRFDNKAGAAGFGANAGDVLSLCKMPEGARLLRFVAMPSGDLDAANTFTFNLGTTSLANAYATNSAALQGTAGVDLGLAALIRGPVAARNDELLLTRTAGALGTAGDVEFIAEFGF